ncbi:hypothetical protein ACFQU2_08490 [Siccirubricoccus deserti]
MPDATLLIEDSVFLGNGALRDGHACARGIYAGRLGALLIRRSRFEATRVCHHVKSRAARTEVVDSQILDTPDDNASYLVDLPNGEEVLLRGNTLHKGPRSGNPGTAIAIGFEGDAADSQPAHSRQPFRDPAATGHGLRPQPQQGGGGAFRQQPDWPGGGAGGAGAGRPLRPAMRHGSETPGPVLCCGATARE